MLANPRCILTGHKEKGAYPTTNYSFAWAERFHCHYNPPLRLFSKVDIANHFDSPNRHEAR